jgi:uncharacterized protein (TIGR02147 family)
VRWSFGAAAMEDIYNYTDYRDYLFDLYKERKKENPAISYRFIDQKTGIDSGFLVKVFKAKNHLTEEAMATMAEFFKINGKELSFFEALYFYSKAKSAAEIKACFKRLMEIIQIDQKQLKTSDYRFYHKWHYSAIRALLSIFDFGSVNFFL